MEKQDIRNLKKRYLVWFYKTTKETLDKIERKFTQLEIDKLILKELRHSDKNKRLQKFTTEFNRYIQNKEKEGLALKYEGGQLRPYYRFLAVMLKAIEKVVIKELGRNTLRRIKSLYEEEMVRRILTNKEHSK